MCGFIAQLVEQRTGNAEVTGSNPFEALIFSGFFFPIAQIGKFTAMILLPFLKILYGSYSVLAAQPNMIYTISCLCSCWCAFDSFEILPQIRFQTPSLIRSLYFLIFKIDLSWLDQVVLPISVMPYWNKAQNTNLKRSLLEVHVAHTKPSRMQRLSAARVCS